MKPMMIIQMMLNRPMPTPLPNGPPKRAIYRSTAPERARYGMRSCWTAVGVTLLCFAAVTDAATPAACRILSGPSKTPLIELYTSEGCDSCPPADRWLSAQFPRVRAPNGAVALAFHVDYWDRLGWTDRFASRAYTERQY